ncbi:MAG TPA: hypothetical protein VGG86_14065 [Roseiarcus sp.]|jgi:hypothetical protein
MDNLELAALLTEGAEALKGIEANLARLVGLRQGRANERPIARDLAHYAPRASVGWPWTGDTVTQGFLSGRWLRRDGNVYSGAALRGVPGPNSPIAGGDDNQAKIDVPSGAPRS